jgi:hypothetical protein
MRWEVIMALLAYLQLAAQTGTAGGSIRGAIKIPPATRWRALR